MQQSFRDVGRHRCSADAGARLALELLRRGRGRGRKGGPQRRSLSRRRGRRAAAAAGHGPLKEGGVRVQGGPLCRVMKSMVFEEGAGLRGVVGGSKRAEQEMSWEMHPGAKWGLRIVNFVVAAFGVTVLVLCGKMTSDEGGTSAGAIVPLYVLGAGSMCLGALGIFATYERKIMAIYWMALFFGTIFGTWLFLYCTVNFSRIESVVQSHFEQNWEALVGVLPEEVLDTLPAACGGNRADWCEFTVDGSETTGFADPLSPTEEEIAACTAATPTEADVICEYQPPCTETAMCVGEYAVSGETVQCEDSCRSPTCTDFYGQACGGDDFWCNPELAHCESCAFSPGDDESCCPSQCTYMPEVKNEALCVATTVLSTADDGRRLQDEATEPEPEPLDIGTSKDFEAQCWSTIKDAIMENMNVVGYCLFVMSLLEFLCMYWCTQVLTLTSAVSTIRKAIDVGMTVFGILILIVGIFAHSQLSEDASYLTVPIICAGVLMICLGVIFGFYSRKHPAWEKYGIAVYVVLLIAMILLAVGCIVYEDTVRDSVAENGSTWLDKFCDTSCYADIQAKLDDTRDADAQCYPPEGTEECYLGYEWATERHLDVACNSTLPHTISQMCKCPCEVAQAAADVKVATEEAIITIVENSINGLGWLCILISLYLTVEIVCHLYHCNAKEDEDSAPTYGGGATGHIHQI